MSISVKTFVLGEVSTNTYIVTEDETGVTAVVDPSVADGELLKFIENLDVKYILLTHGHFDHIMGAEAVKKATGAKIVIHKDDEIAFTDGKISLISYHHPEINLNLNGDIIVEDGTNIPFGNTNIYVMHTPGHTRGGVCYIFENEKLLFSGDTLFKLSAGRTDFIGGNPRTEILSLRKIAALDGDYKVYPGHGESTTLSYERQYNRYIKFRG